MNSYNEFLKSKVIVAPESGFDVEPGEVNHALKHHQRDAVIWGCNGGRRALFESFGLGKTAYDEVQIPYEVVATGADAARVIRLLDAEDEGRLVVLPCKVGDTVFSAFENEGVFCGKVYAISTCDGTNWFSVRYDGGLRYDHTWDEIGKTVFFAREDAEKALEGMNNDHRID